MKPENVSRLILDNISVQIYLIDHNYRIVDYNCAFANQIKLSKEKIIGEPCYKLSHNSAIPCYEMKDTICPAKTAFGKHEKCRAIHKHFINDKVIIEEVVSTPINNGQYVLEEYRDLSDLIGLGFDPCKVLLQLHQYYNLLLSLLKYPWT